LIRSKFINLENLQNLPERRVPTIKKALTVRPSSIFEEGLNSAGAPLFFKKYIGSSKNKNMKIDKSD